MKRNIIIGVLLVVAIVGAWMWREKMPYRADDQAPEQGKLTYNDPEGMFTFSHPNGYSVSGRQEGLSTDWKTNTNLPGLVLATVSVSRSYLPQTNFSDAKLVIGWSNNDQAIRTCSATTNDPLPNGPVITQAEVSGFPFTKMVSLEAAAGNLYETTSYMGLLDGDCFAIEYVIHSTNIANYDPNQGITEFDKAKIQRELEGIVESFRFLVNSD